MREKISLNCMISHDSRSRWCSSFSFSDLSLLLIDEFLEEFWALLLPGIVERGLNSWVSLCWLLDDLVFVVAEVGILQVCTEGGVEDRELCDAVTEAETLSHREEGKLGGLGGAGIEAVLVDDLREVAKEVWSLAILIVGVQGVAVETL